MFSVHTRQNGKTKLSRTENRNTCNAQVIRQNNWNKKRKFRFKSISWSIKNKEKFYEKFGFIKRIDADLGYGMILTENWIGEHYVANRIFRKIKWRDRWNY